MKLYVKMNKSILFNQTILTGKHYIEEICSDYFAVMNFNFIKFIILNCLYFLILKDLIAKIPEIGIKNFKINPPIILEFIIYLCNLFLLFYYIIFNYTSIIFNKFKIINFIITICFIFTIIFLIYKNRTKIMKFIKLMSEKDGNN